MGLLLSPFYLVVATGYDRGYHLPLAREMFPQNDNALDVSKLLAATG